MHTYMQLFSTSLIRQASTCVMVCSCCASRGNLRILCVWPYKYVCGHIQTCYQLCISNVCNGFVVYCVGFDLHTYIVHSYTLYVVCCVCNFYLLSLFCSVDPISALSLALQYEGIECDVLFGNIDEVCQISEELIAAMEEKEQIGSVFVRMSKVLLEVYTAYCKNHNLATLALKKVLPSPPHRTPAYSTPPSHPTLPLTPPHPFYPTPSLVPPVPTVHGRPCHCFQTAGVHGDGAREDLFLGP